jgi:hypothetical protein
MRIKSRDSESENDDAESASSASRSFFWSLSGFVLSCVFFLRWNGEKVSFLNHRERIKKSSIYAIEGLVL